MSETSPHIGPGPSPPRVPARTMHDALPLPGGKHVGDEMRLTSALVAAGVAGVDHGMGRAVAAEVYAKHIEKIRKDGADAAVKSWLESAGRP